LSAVEALIRVTKVSTFKNTALISVSILHKTTILV